MDTELLAARLEALGKPSRLDLYRALVRAGPTGLAVGALQERTGIARSTLSHHLHKLIAVGLVSQVREGTTLRCHACFDVMDETLGYLRSECCADVTAHYEAAVDQRSGAQK